MLVSIVNATSKHAEQLAPLMRAADLDECLAAGYPDGRSALDRALLESTEAFAVLFDGEVAAMVGVDPLGLEATLVWVITGRAVDRAALSFIRTSRQLLRYFLSKHRRLVNLVDARYQGALDWLECLGFAIGPVVPHPDTGLPFRLASIGGA